jgi:hypothetical protein
MHHPRKLKEIMYSRQNCSSPQTYGYIRIALSFQRCGLGLPRLTGIDFLDFREMLHELKFAHERAVAKVRQPTPPFGFSSF